MPDYTEFCENCGKIIGSAYEGQDNCSGVVEKVDEIYDSQHKIICKKCSEELDLSVKPEIRHFPKPVFGQFRQDCWDRGLFHKPLALVLGAIDALLGLVRFLFWIFLVFLPVPFVWLFSDALIPDFAVALVIVQVLHIIIALRVYTRSGFDYVMSEAIFMALALLPVLLFWASGYPTVGYVILMIMEILIFWLFWGKKVKTSELFSQRR